VTVRYARACDVLGIAVLIGGPADVGVQTLAESSLFRIDSRTLTAAAHRDARVSLALAEELSRRLYQTLQQTATRNSTVLTNVMNPRPSGSLRLVVPIAASRVKSAVATNLETLKKILEQGP
jgi:hypothetical protein